MVHMKLVVGEVLVLESGRPVVGLGVTVFAKLDGGGEGRVGSIATDERGRFRLEADGAGYVWDLRVEIAATTPTRTVLYADDKHRERAGDLETWTVRLPTQALVAAGVLPPTRSVADELPALGSIVARAVTDASFETERQNVVRGRLDPRRASAAQLTTRFRQELLARGRGGAPTQPSAPVASRLREAVARGLNQAKLQRPRRGFATLSAAERAAVEAATASDGTIAAGAIEPLLFGPALDGPRLAVDLLNTVCRRPRTLAEACTTPPPEQPPPPPLTTVDDLAVAVWAQLHPSDRAIERRPTDADVIRRIDGLQVSTGPADAPALHDFSVLHVPIEDVWVDLIDEDSVRAAGALYDELERLGGRPAATTGALVDHLLGEATFVIKQAPEVIRRAQVSAQASLLWAEAGPTGLPDPLALEGTGWVSALLAELDRKLAEPYRFTVYAADDSGTAINFGLITTYRQRWTPLGYQAGRLVETVTLAPREERTYSRKVATSGKRRQQTQEKARSVLRTEEQLTQRAVRDIVETAELRTGFEASGVYGGGSGSLKIDDARTSSDTRQQFREAVIKAAREYENDHTIDVSFESATDTTVEQTGKIVNPNEELAVTYLFYQLQRRYHVAEHLHRMTPVVLVAQPVPKPNYINVAWLLQHDWILRRVLLDPSFVSALDTINTSLVGEEATVGQLRADLEHQRGVVEALRQTLVAQQSQVETLFRGLRASIISAAEAEDAQGAWQSVSQWIAGGGSEEANRARVETAREALERAQARERAMAEQLGAEAKHLSAMTDRWGAATRALLDKTVDVQRLRLHVKQNILYYMQAIWDHEPADQRVLRLHQLPVPMVDGQLSYRVVPSVDEPPLPPHWTRPVVVEATLAAEVASATVPLGELADLERPLGYRGNYAIFPLRDSHLIARYLTVPFVDRHGGAHDPDHLANLTRAELERYACCLREVLPPDDYEAVRPGLEEAHRRVLTDPRPLEEEVVVPTDALFIEALPAAHPLLEDFKLRHRAADAAKAEAEAARARLENLRLGARLLAGDLSDPDIDRKTVIQGVPAGVVIGGGDP